MRPSKSPGHEALAALAARQHGVVAHWQLMQAGLGRQAVKHRVRTGRLHRVQFGVYAVGHAALTWYGRCMAAVLSYGPGAVLSHRTAAALWEIRRSSSPIVEVTVAERGRHARGGIRLHRVRGLHADDRAVHEGIPVTSVARTLLDFAEVAPPRELERAVEEAERRRIFDLREIEGLCERSPGRRGCPRLARVLAAHSGPPPRTRSELERDFLDLTRDAALPQPLVNGEVVDLEVDFVWHEQRLAVELDSREFHLTPAAFERDRMRDAALQLTGYRVVRITHRRLANEPAEVAEVLRSLLGTSAPAARPPARL